MWNTVLQSHRAGNKDSSAKMLNVGTLLRIARMDVAVILQSTVCLSTISYAPN
jgi:hypothetical protein